MPTVHFETFGCQMNVADSAMLADVLASRGYTEAASAAEADLIVVNTCSVRANAEKRALARIGEFASRKTRAHCAQKLWVVGCMAQSMGDNIIKQFPAVDRVIGAARIEHISHDIDGYLADSEAGACAAGFAPVSSFLPVMRGCDNFCGYCIVPYVRGREHSVPLESILARTRDLTDRGAREITLLGQNVNSYRDGGRDFAVLLEKLHGVDGVRRIRFTTSHPKDLNQRLIRAVATLPRVCRHLHLPVQSGSSRILSAMNRRYSREDYLAKIEAVRTLVPDIDISTDIMTGYPGETDADFRETVSLMQKVRFTAAFMFAYSPRPGTAAAKSPDQVPEEIRRQRLREIIAMQTEITRSRYDAMVGNTARVLVTGRQEKKQRAWMGQDNGCKRVLIHCEDELAGTILDVRITASTGMTLIGERVAQ